jgi:hypothetical protein
MMVSTGANSLLVYQSALKATNTVWLSCQHKHLRASKRMGEGNENLVYPSPWDFKRSLTCRKILRHGTCGFTSHPKERVLRIFIALKYLSPWPGSNPRTLRPVASTLTTTPPLPFSENGPTPIVLDPVHRANPKLLSIVVT